MISDMMWCNFQPPEVESSAFSIQTRLTSGGFKESSSSSSSKGSIWFSLQEGTKRSKLMEKKKLIVEIVFSAFKG